MGALLISLLILGLLLSAIEIFVPGFGILGIAGLVFITISAVLTIIHVPYGLMIVVSELIVLGICLHLLIKWAKQKQLYGNLILKEVLSQEKKAVDNFDKLIGQDGVAVVPIKPFGSAAFNGINIDVYSEGAYIPKGRTVRVINVENNKVIVKEMN